MPLCTEPLPRAEYNRRLDEQIVQVARDKPVFGDGGDGGGDGNGKETGASAVGDGDAGAAVEKKKKKKVRGKRSGKVHDARNATYVAAGQTAAVREKENDGRQKQQQQQQQQVQQMQQQ